MKRVLVVVIAALAGGALVLGATPARIDAHAWTAPAAVALEGPFAPNEKLRGLDWWAKTLIGPEAIWVEPDGSLITGLADGRIVQLKPLDETPKELANTGGRPLAIARHPDGRLYLTDAHRGLLALNTDGTIEVLSSHLGGVPFIFADDLAIDRNGVVYFTDASAHFSIENYKLDLLEHQKTGRVLKYEPATKTTSVVVSDLNFANGIALSPDESHVIVTETGGYQLWRVWVNGPKSGTKEPFGPVLPAFPDNLRRSPTRGVYWVALGAPRDPIVDLLDGSPALRGVIAKLPESVQPKPVRHAFVMAIDLEGKVVETLHDRSADSYSPIASVVEHDGSLYLGSFVREGLARVKLSP